MPPLRSLAPALSVTVALGLAFLGGTSSDAHARSTVKAAAPTLEIESKVCNIGPNAEDRSATITASSILSGTGDRVSIKFGIQQRQGKAKWRALPAGADSGLGTWETSQAGRAGLRYTKTINGLAEGIQYRVTVDARGLGESGKVVTKTARRYVPCTQPLFTPTFGLVKATDAQVAGGAHEVTATVRNVGRLPFTAPGVVTVYDGTTRAILATTDVAPLEGGDTTKIVVPIATCTSDLVVVVMSKDALPTDSGEGRTATIPCAGTKSATRARP